MRSVESKLKHKIERFFSIQRQEIDEFEDLGASNWVYSFIVKEQKYVIKKLDDSSIVNWEQAGMADPLLDIAVSAIHQGFHYVDPVWCLHHYLKRIPEKQEFFRLFAFLALDCFAWTAWCIYADQEDFEQYLDYAIKYTELVLNYY